MSSTTTVSLTNINIIPDITLPMATSATIFITWTTVVHNSDAVPPMTQSTKTYGLTRTSDVSNECALVQTIFNSVFSSPQFPDPTVSNS